MKRLTMVRLAVLSLLAINMSGCIIWPGWHDEGHHRGEYHEEHHEGHHEHHDYR